MLRRYLPVAFVLLLTGCASLNQQQADSVDTPLIADQRFHDLQALVKGDQPDDKTVQARFDKALALYESDPEYACRHPIFAHYFSRRQGQALNTSQCPQSVPFYLYDHRHGGVVRHVRPDQVVAIHLLFFSNSDSIASRFGHVGLRLVICPTEAPSNATLRREACDQNLFEHVTLGYMAQVNELKTSVYKGLTGGYPAHLMAFPFMDTYYVNTVLEDRNIYSLPLALNAPLIHEVVRELSEIQWSYSGRYRFFTNNCATLLQDTLNETLHKSADQSPLPGSDYLRPDSLFAAIKASPIGESAHLDSLEKAEAAGFYFPSNRPYYRKALEMLNQHSDSASYASLQDYIAAPAQQRLQPWLDDSRFTNELTRNKRLLNALLLVEEYALLTTDEQITRETIKVLAKKTTKTRLEQLLDTVGNPPQRRFLRGCYLQPLKDIAGETRRSDGIPDNHFINRHYGQAVDCKQPVVREQVNAKIKAHLSSSEDSFSYIDYLGNQLSITQNNLTLLEQLQ